MKKMTDNEIIKALECCVNDICEECPYDECFDNLNEENKILKDALDLINHLKANEEKNETIIRLADKTIEKQQAEIERLKKNLNDVSKCNINLMYRMDKAKSEARKELAERLKSYIDVGHLREPTEICFSDLDVVNIIDRILKEMEEN